MTDGINKYGFGSIDLKGTAEMFKSSDTVNIAMTDTKNITTV